MDKTFRVLIIIAAVVYVVFYSLPYFNFMWLNQETLEFLSKNGSNSIITLPYTLVNILYALWLINSIGLYFYYPISRKAFVVLLVLSLLLIPFVGNIAFSPVEALLITVTNTIEGALLILMYFTSVKVKFEQKA